MSVLRKLRRLPERHPHELLLLLTALVLVCFAFPALDRLSYLFYSLIALLLGRLGGGRSFGPYGRADKAAAEKALGQVGLHEMRRRFFSALSGGERQRALIEIGRAHV